MSSFNRFQHSCAYTAHRGTPRSRSVDLDPTPSCRDCRPPWCKMCLQFNKAQVEVAIAQNTANEGFHDRDITFSNNLELVTYKAEGKCKRLHKAWHSNVFDRRPLPEGQDCTVAGASCIRINSAGRSWQLRLLSPANWSGHTSAAINAVKCTPVIVVYHKLQVLCSPSPISTLYGLRKWASRHVVTGRTSCTALS